MAGKKATKDKKTTKEDYILHHKDGSLYARGTMIDGQPDGYFEFFRKDGTKMRSGYFRRGKQFGEWTTYDREGNVVKITRMKE